MIQKISQYITNTPCGCHGPIRQFDYIQEIIVSDEVKQIANNVISELKLKNVGESLPLAFVFGVSLVLYFPFIPVAMGIVGVGAFMHNMSYSCPITSKLPIFLVNECLQQNPSETHDRLVKYVEKEWPKFYNYQCDKCQYGE